jgi:3-deoxy-D-manno-octulosonic-acid transferase
MLAGQKDAKRLLKEKIEEDGSYIWFHAASLGEFEQGRPLIERLKAEFPQYKILLTFFSPSGYEVRKNYPLADVVCYLPFDTSGRVREFLRLAHPVMAIFIKYEFWYNYLRELRRLHIPVFSISAIFRPEQWFFHWYGRPFLAALRCFRHIFVQDEPSCALLKRFGFVHVSVAGDTRFDRVSAVSREARPLPLLEKFAAGQASSPFVLVAGSTWPLDEDLLIPYFNAHPEMKLVLAPHEFDESRLEKLLASMRRPAVRLSKAKEADMVGADCLVIDCFGLLSSVYRYGNLAYVGGGFGKGIHNILEAAVYGIPVIFGPNYGKFKEARDLLACGGGFSVDKTDSFQACVDGFRTDAGRLSAAGRAAGDFVNEHTGATEHIMQALPLKGAVLQTSSAN